MLLSTCDVSGLQYGIYSSGYVALDVVTFTST